jgi:hypothetical protein
MNIVLDHRASPLLRYTAFATAVIAVTATVPGDPFYADEGAGSLGSAIAFTLTSLTAGRVSLLLSREFEDWIRRRAVVPA